MVGERVPVAVPGSERLDEDKPPLPDGWQPRLVALDIDGTLLKWVEDEGQTYEQISPAVYDAVHAAHLVAAVERFESDQAGGGIDLFDHPARIELRHPGEAAGCARVYLVGGLGARGEAEPDEVAGDLDL